MSKITNKFIQNGAKRNLQALLFCFAEMDNNVAFVTTFVKGV